eukprot:378248-Pyramimonas_sp.AAC.1
MSLLGRCTHCIFPRIASNKACRTEGNIHSICTGSRGFSPRLHSTKAFPTVHPRTPRYTRPFSNYSQEGEPPKVGPLWTRFGAKGFASEAEQKPVAMSSVKVAVGQMTSIGDAERNFAVCSDLVEQAKTVRAAVDINIRFYPMRLSCVESVRSGFCI